jgi:antitoxin component HigA of HigAB toxin-antitoxin module
MHSATAQLRAIVLATLDQQGVKQVELADRIGHSQKHVSQALTGACGLSLNLASKMLAALGADLVVSTVPSAIRLTASDSGSHQSNGSASSV